MVLLPVECLSPFDLVLSYPQWQGSGRSENLVRGALAAAATFSGLAETARVDLSARTGDGSGINRFEAILDQLNCAQEILKRVAPKRLLTLGGDCAVDIAIIDYLIGRYPDLTVIWIDSHFDANTPDTSPSGNLHGMPVAAIMGELPPPMKARLHHPLSSERFHYVWANVFDEGDRSFQQTRQLRWLSEDEALAGPIHIHFDLDVLNPEEFPHLAYAEENGMPVASALSLMKRLAKSDIVGLTFTEFSPASDEDAEDGMKTIVALLDAVSS